MSTFQFSSDGMLPGIQKLSPRFGWPKMAIIKASLNALKSHTRNFLASLNYFGLLTSIAASECNLQGEVPMEVGPDGHPFTTAREGATMSNLLATQ